MPTRQKTFLATFNLLLIIVGYQFVSTFFSFLIDDVEGASRIVTVPYRAFAATVALLTILVNIKNKYTLHPTVVVLLLYWFFLLVRFFYDMYFSVDVQVSNAAASRTLLFMVPVTIIPMFSVMKSYRYIDFDKLFKWTIILFSITVIFSFFNNEEFQVAADSRIGTAAQGTIGVGHFGLTVLVLSVYMLITKRLRITHKVLVVLVMIISLLVMLRAGSKGPIMSLIGIAAIWILGASEKKLRNIFILLFAVALGYLLMGFIKEFINDISPVLYRRMFETDDILSDRGTLYKIAVDVFVDNPILGGSFAIYRHAEGFSYAHNLFLDSLMQLGIVGGLMMLYVSISTLLRILKIITLSKPYYWIALLLMQSFMLLMVSSAFYFQPLFSILIVLLFMPLDSENIYLLKNDYFEPDSL